LRRTAASSSEEQIAPLLDALGRKLEAVAAASRATVTHIDDEVGSVRADGLLSVDGRPIYQMHGFTVRIPVGSATATAGMV
jgi:hypothetical protein